MYRCPTHGLNCPSNFSINNNKKLVLRNNKIGKPFGASDVNININRYESLNNIRKMFGLTSNESVSLKGASNSTQNNTYSKKEHLKDLLKQFNLI